MPFVVPSTFGQTCSHLRQEDSTAGKRCLDCGQTMPVLFTFQFAPGTICGASTTVTTTGTATHCEHGRRYALGACHECQRSPCLS